MKDFITAEERLDIRPNSIEKQLLNLIKQHGSLVIKECRAGLFIERYKDSKGIGNMINNKISAKFTEV